MQTTTPKPQRRGPGAGPGNVNALKHGFYSRLFRKQELADLEEIGPAGLQNEIAMLRVMIRRVFEQASDEAADLETWSKALATLGAASTRLAELLWTQKKFSMEEADVTLALSQALTEVVKELER